MDKPFPLFDAFPLGDELGSIELIGKSEGKLVGEQEGSDNGSKLIEGDRLRCTLWSEEGLELSDEFGEADGM